MRPTLYTLLLALLLLVAPTAEAQKDKKAPAHPTPSMRERVRSEKRAYLIQRLSLTAKEADDITPILDELDEKRFQLWREGMALGHRVRQGDKTLTEAELEKTYYLRCRPYLTAQKMVQLPMVCKEFARRFFERHKH